MNNENSNSDYNEYIGGVLCGYGVPIMPAAFSIETDYAYELYLEFCAGGYEDECDYGKGEV